MNHTGHQNGFILMPVIIAIVLVATIAFLLNNQSAINVTETGDMLEVEQAEQLTRAGLAHAIWQTQNSGCAGDIILPSTVFGTDRYDASVTSAATTTSYTLNVLQDAWLKESAPAENNGGDIELSVKAAAGDNMRTLYQFDLSTLPAGASIGSATAWFYVTGNDDNDVVDIHQATTGWIEASADWATMGDKFDAAIIASIPVQASNAVFVQVNLTSLVQAWVNGEPNNGIMLLANSAGVESKYTSREWPTSSQQPRLEVVATSGAASPVQIIANGTLASGVTRSLKRTDVPVYQPGSYTRLQPGAVSGEDAEIWDQAPNNNYGNAAETWVSSASNDKTRTLLRFNMGTIPAGARILGATLSLDRQSGSGADQPVSAHRIINSWSEDSVTWNLRETSTNWDTAGGDFDNIAVATTPVGPVNQRYEWEIMPLVQGWVGGSYPNYGVALTAAIDGMPGERFYTSDHADPSRWPSLSISYACECGIACIAPQGTGKIALIGKSLGLLPDPSDKAKEDILESWGYNVDIYDDDLLWTLNSSNYDAIYISSAASDSTLVDQLKYEPIGIIYELVEQNNDLGMSDGDASSVGTDINIIDTSHYITQLFTAGALTIKAAASRLSTISGTPAAGAQVLANTAGTESLLAIESGDALGGIATGEFASARRVMLPLGQTATDDWSHLNNNGLLIVQRALQWGTGITGPVVSTPIIMSTDSAATLGGLNFDDIDLVDYEIGNDVASLFFEGALTTLTIDIDAVHVLANGHILLSTKDAATLGGLSFLDGDLVDYDPVTDSATLFFNESAFSADEDIVSVYVTSTGRLIFSTDTDATLGTLSFTDNDLVEYDPATDTASMFLDGSTKGLSSDIDAVHVLDDGHIVLSTKDNATLGGLSFLDGDLVDYDPVTDAAVLYFEEGLFSGGEDVISAHIGAGSGALNATGGGGTAPMAHWMLDETSGLTAVDSVGGHDGVVTAGTWIPGGIVDGALELNGTGNIRVPHDNQLILTDAFTMSAWVKADTIFGYHTIINKGTTGNNQDYWFGVWNNWLTVGFYTGGGFQIVEAQMVGWNPAQATHLAATFGNASDTIQLYWDGSLLHTGTMTYEPPAGTEDLIIGRSQLGEYWDGVLDDVRIYDSVLPASEITDLFTAGSGGGGGEPPPPTGCDGTFRDEFNTETYSANDGTLTWSGDWIEVGESDGPTGGDEQIVNDLTDFQLRTQDNDNGGEGVEREADLTGAASATLAYDYRRKNLDNTDDYTSVEISANGASGPWNELTRYPGPGSDVSYQTISHDISGFISANTRIRFKTSASLGFKDAVFFDNIEIQCAP